MKGLIIKDFMCLRKNAKVLIFSFVGIILLGLMILLSMRYGNIYRWNQEAIADGSANVESTEAVFSFVVMLFMAIPVMLAGEPAMLLDLDGKAGFDKVYSSLPVPIEKRVAAKYISYILFTGVSVIVDVILAVGMSFMIDFLQLQELLKIVMATASFVVIIGALTIFLIYCLGYAQCINSGVYSAIIVFGVIILLNFEKTKMFFKLLFSSEEQEGSADVVRGMINSFSNSSWHFLIAAIVTLSLSLVGTIFVVKRKRGMI